MNKIQIQIPEGFKIKSFDTETGNVSFEPIPQDIKERIKTFEDVMKHLGIDPEEFDDRIEDMTPDEAAYVKLKHIAQALNEGWKPNWNDSNERKYHPWFDMRSASGGFSFDGYGYWLTPSGVGSRLCFKSSELARYAGTQFESIYKDFLTLNS